jgi:hypothetical protein
LGDCRPFLGVWVDKVEIALGRKPEESDLLIGALLGGFNTEWKDGLFERLFQQFVWAAVPIEAELIP